MLNEPLFAGTDWYVAGGWRFGKLTPLLEYFHDQREKSLATSGSDNGFTAVLRWDIVQNIALKAQITRANADDPPYWVTLEPGNAKKVNIYGFGADFVF